MSSRGTSRCIKQIGYLRVHSDYSRQSVDRTNQTEFSQTLIECRLAFASASSLHSSVNRDCICQRKVYVCGDVGFGAIFLGRDDICAATSSFCLHCGQTVNAVLRCNSVCNFAGDCLPVRCNSSMSSPGVQGVCGGRIGQSCATLW